ncbi:hypothetical protein BKA93DRAFT_826924 [Sparassis latifolia]
MGLNDLPNELIIEIFTYLPVYSIFQVRAVSKKWCGLVAATPIDPVRRALLKLYLKAITSPVLLDTQPEVISYAAEFDGEAYASSIEALTRRPLPEAFHMWLLEWPAHAVIKRLWPGLPSVCKNIVRFGGVCLFPQPDLELQKFSLKLEDNKYALHFEVADWDDGNDWVCGIPMYYEQDQKVMWRMYLLLSGKGKGETWKAEQPGAWSGWIPFIYFYLARIVRFGMRSANGGEKGVPKDYRLRIYYTLNIGGYVSS